MLRFQAEKRLKNFNYSVSFCSDAEITALFAPSGSGKTVTLQMIAGLQKPERGKIEVNGRVFFSSERKINVPPQKRNVGYLFQDYALFPHMTVQENICFSSKDKNLFKEVVELLEIGDILNKLPAQISGGQKQRVALARAIMRKPEILLLDEPFSALHRSLKENLYRELFSIVKRFNQKVVIVTHDFDEVLRLAKKVVILENGKNVQEGSPEEVFFSPKTVKIAKLLGHKNFLKGKVVKTDREFTVVEVKGKLRLKLKRRTPLKAGQEVTVSILPMSAALSPATEFSRVEVLVKRVEKMGNLLFLQVEMEGEEVELHLPLSLTPNYILEEGKKTTLHLSAEQICIVEEEE